MDTCITFRACQSCQMSWGAVRIHSRCSCSKMGKDWQYSLRRKVDFAKRHNVLGYRFWNNSTSLAVSAAAPKTRRREKEQSPMDQKTVPPGGGFLLGDT